ncbi:MAG: hypothetical protein WC774_01700 [Candidatus Gracilibacteria bacterium]
MITEEISDRMQYLLGLGFSETTVNTFLRYNKTLYHKEWVHEKITELYRLGFDNPIKLITSSPSILGYSITENIQPKLEELRKLGFENPIKLITTLPTILGYSITENIQPKMRILDKFVGDKEISRNLVYSAPELLGTKKDKSWIILHGLQELNMMDEGVIKIYKRINMSEIESFVLVVGRLKNDSDFMNLSLSEKLSKLLSQILVQKKIGDKKERMKLILSGEKTKITARYIRGYASKLDI